ncbi:MAG: hypothetical protein GXX82_16525 [Syntrophorhabdus sp.]|nr:hypothetical protein [Syntrophorhabdus sp.]
MTDVFAEAMTDILDDEDLGQDAVYEENTIRVLFQNGFVVVNGVETTAPIAECLDTDVTGVAHGDTITVSGVTYNIIGIQPTGSGTTKLILSGDSHG